MKTMHMYTMNNISWHPTKETIACTAVLHACHVPQVVNVFTLDCAGAAQLNSKFGLIS